jgi:hypothetical protein
MKSEIHTRKRREWTTEDSYPLKKNRMEREEAQVKKPPEKKEGARSYQYSNQEERRLPSNNTWKNTTTRRSPQLNWPI